MKARVAIALLMGGSIVAGSFFASAASQSHASSISPTRPAAWEFQSIKLNSSGDLGSEVRELGRHGWEMVDVIAITTDGCTDYVMCYFRRSR